LRPEWFLEADTVGITAGTSTPDDVIGRVQDRIHRTASEVVEAPRP
jgi:4-hydroxy-3-methylbut-2-enyl diphosphate reductase IspH